MPLKSGKSKRIIRENTKELAESLIRKGKPVKKAYEMAYAGSMRKAGKSKRKK